MKTSKILIIVLIAVVPMGLVGYLLYKPLKKKEEEQLEEVISEAIDNQPGSSMSLEDADLTGLVKEVDSDKDSGSPFLQVERRDIQGISLPNPVSNTQGVEVKDAIKKVRAVQFETIKLS